MKIASRRYSRKTLPLIVIALVTIGVIGVGIAYWASQRQPEDTAQQSPDDAINLDPPTEEELTDTEKHKEEVIKEHEQAENTPPDAAPAVTITRAHQTDGGQPLNIRTIVNGTTEGTCVVTLTKAGQPTVEKTFPIIFQATYATCQQADIAASEFPAEGEWSLSVVAHHGSSQSSPATQTVIITK